MGWTKSLDRIICGGQEMLYSHRLVGQLFMNLVFFFDESLYIEIQDEVKKWRQNLANMTFSR